MLYGIISGHSVKSLLSPEISKIRMMAVGVYDNRYAGVYKTWPPAFGRKKPMSGLDGFCVYLDYDPGFFRESDHIVDECGMSKWPSISKPPSSSMVSTCSKYFSTT